MKCLLARWLLMDKDNYYLKLGIDLFLNTILVGTRRLLPYVKPGMHTKTTALFLTSLSMSHWSLV